MDFPVDEFIDLHAPLLPVPGIEGLTVHQAYDPFRFWESSENFCGNDLDAPHAVIVWPAAQVLGSFLVNNPVWVRGKKVIEAGAGGGTAALAALKAGATRAAAVDSDPFCCHVAGLNARANGLELQILQSDILACIGSMQWDVLLFADFFYRREVSMLLLPLMKDWKKAGRVILVSDGGRAFVPPDMSALLYETVVKVNKDLEGTTERIVRIWEF